MKKVTLFLVIVLIFLIGILYLQYRLSKSENKKLGFILPILSFSVSSIYILNIFLGYGSFTSITSMSDAVANNFILIIILLVSLVMWNIPTLILIMIYLFARDKIKKDKQLEKMNIYDL